MYLSLHKAHGDRNHQPYANKKGSSVKCVEMRAPKGHNLIVQGIALGGHWGLHTPCMVAHRLFSTWLQEPPFRTKAASGL